MTAALSLRARLTVIILGPLLLIALAVGLWQVRNARATAADLFDRSLLTTALAVAGDVARSDGEVLSTRTSDLLADTSGGRVFYHVYAPDGVFVIGYATPPVPVETRPPADDAPAFYNARYLGRDVRVARLRDVATIGGMSGTFTITVWQDVALRDAFRRDLVTRTFIVIAALIGGVALVVWFGVNLGLRPLLDLEDAISRRSSDDLSPIRRAVPVEARGLVARLNALLDQVSGVMEAQAAFVSNAAHQLRNPIAGVLAMAEAVRSAPTKEAARSRAGELLAAARHASDLANKLLTLERAKGGTQAERVDLGAVLRPVLASHEARAAAAGVALDETLPSAPIAVDADPVMLREAVANLIDNALRHGGHGLTRIAVTLSRDAGCARIEVADDGRGIDPARADRMRARFQQAAPGEGSGLGLSIAEAIAEAHGGSLSLDPAAPGLRVTLRLPLAAA